VSKLTLARRALSMPYPATTISPISSPASLSPAQGERRSNWKQSKHLSSAPRSLPSFFLLSPLLVLASCSCTNGKDSQFQHRLTTSQPPWFRREKGRERQRDRQRWLPGYIWISLEWVLSKIGQRKGGENGEVKRARGRRRGEGLVCE
jgi:hypothetical protein